MRIGNEQKSAFNVQTKLDAAAPIIKKLETPQPEPPKIEEPRSNENSALSRLQELESRYATLSEDLKKANEQGEAVRKEWEVKLKCLRIAMRVLEGDRVPSEDLRFLADNDSELYKTSLMMKKYKRDPKEYDRISEDEEEENGDTSEAAAGAPADAMPTAASDTAPTPSSPEEPQ